jgi:hypothetical protein
MPSIIAVYGVVFVAISLKMRMAQLLSATEAIYLIAYKMYEYSVRHKGNPHVFVPV